MIEEKIANLEKAADFLKVEIEDSKSKYLELSKSIADFNAEVDSFEFAESASGFPYIKSIKFKADKGGITSEFIQGKLALIAELKKSLRPESVQK